MNLEKLKSFFTQLFTEIDSEDSFYILLFLSVAFLIGLLFGALSRNRKIRRLTKMVKARDNDLITLRTENGAFKEQLEINEENLQKAQHDYEETNALLGEMEQNRNEVYAELQDAKNIVSRLSAQNEANTLHINDLKASLLASQENNESLDESTSSLYIADTGDDSSEQSSTNTPVNTDRLSALEEKLENLEGENIHLRSQLIDIKGQSGVVSDDSLAALKARLEQVEVENDRLQKDLTGLKGGIIPTNTAPTNTVLDSTKNNSVVEENSDVEESTSEEREAKARAALNAAYGTRIKRETAANKSDLKLLAGVGPFIENKLNDIGIYTFEQIAQLDSEMIQHITNAIQFFPGRIQRDDWVGQAKKLMG